MVAQNTDLRASFALGTVKKRIMMCGKPAVPNIKAIPKEIAEIGSFTKPPGPMIEKPLAAAAAAVDVAKAAGSAAGLAFNASAIKPF